MLALAIAGLTDLALVEHWPSTAADRASRRFRSWCSHCCISSPSTNVCTARPGGSSENLDLLRAEVEQRLNVGTRAGAAGRRLGIPVRARAVGHQMTEKRTMPRDRRVAR